MRTPILSFILDFFSEPRDTDLVVQNLSLSTLFLLAHTDATTEGLLPYHNPLVRALVWEVKYYAHKRALHFAGAILAETLLNEASETLGIPLLIPIPIHPKRRKQRGHNQAELLCQAALTELHKHTQSNIASPLEYAPNVLIRIKNTHPQQGLPKHLRQTNVQNAMEVTEHTPVMGRDCIVIDDVTTTGATFAEARRALRAAGATRVHCVALAGATTSPYVLYY